jgi:hypothetical protein
MLSPLAQTLTRLAALATLSRNAGDGGRRDRAGRVRAGAPMHKR